MAAAKDLWFRTTEELGANPELIGSQWELLSRLYSEPTRFYHTMKHIDRMAESMWRIFPDAPAAMRLAIIYHDAIYNPQKRDNEEQSASLARESLERMGIDRELQELVAELVMCTKSHQGLPGEAADMSCKLLDLDLSILGALPSDYERYADEIRKEYAFVPEEQYRAERSSVLDSFLQREHIYLSKEIKSLYESQARFNLKNELQRLQEKPQNLLAG